MNTTAARWIAPPAAPLLQRFLWKEYRMLRGFWLAVLVLGAIEQLVSSFFLPNAESVRNWMFASAWGAAALFAVGAAITLFSAEREERTHDFLMQLPQRWLPMFVGKVLLAILSAVALALVLSLVGWYIAGQTWPKERRVSEILSVAGVAVVEATVWGLLFSLVMKQPLLAAIMSMAAASIGAQCAIALTAQHNPGFTTASYENAVLPRLLLCLAVFFLDIWLAARWLVPKLGTQAAAAVGNRGILGRKQALALDTANPLLAQRAAVTRPSRRGMFARLLWQTWRESWKTMFAAVPIALLLMAGIAMSGWLGGAQEISIFFCPLVLPALFGALAFRADQRTGHRDFLVVHAGRPRWIWLARQCVWLTALVTLAAVVQIAVLWFGGWSLNEAVERNLRHFQWYGYYHSEWSTAWSLKSSVAMTWYFTKLAWCAVLAAYGTGQLCSMLLRREVLAGFLALLVATLLTAWSGVVAAWQLSPACYVLPIAVVTLWATWLRAPDWILSDNRVRAWLKPAVAIILPLALVLTTLPNARLSQIPSGIEQGELRYLQVGLTASLKDWQKRSPAARASVTAYEQVQAGLVPAQEAIDRVEVDGKRYEEYDFLNPPIEASELGGAYGGVGYGSAEYGGEFNSSGLLDIETLTPEQREVYDKFEGQWSTALLAANRDVIPAIDDFSGRTDATIPIPAEKGRSLAAEDDFQEIQQLLVDDAARLLEAGELDEALDRLLSLARLGNQLQTRKTTLEWANLRLLPRQLDWPLVDWALHHEQTSESIRNAIGRMQAVFNAAPDAREMLLADYQFVREILLGNEPPTFLQMQHPRWLDYLPWLGHQLPWERQRALEAHRLRSAQLLNYVDAVSRHVRGDILRHNNRAKSYGLRDLLHVDYSTFVTNHLEVVSYNWDAYTRMQRIAAQCETSYLVSQEMTHRLGPAEGLLYWIDGQIAQQGLLTQLALIAYHRDHGQYPETLEELAPEYLDEVPRDPYSGAAFVYRREGLDAPLAHHHHVPSVPADTGLFWSVGIAYYQPELRQVHNERDQERYATESETIYLFQQTAYSQRLHPNLVFPLPKIQ